jgi:hypothetical protein
LRDEDMVLGVSFRTDEGALVARAYSHNLLWWHEIANDEVFGQRFTVSYCPLTGSGLVFPGGQDAFSFGTSGKLFNSNLIMYDRVSDSQWSQMMRRAITGPRAREELPILPVIETTWERWRSLHPDTAVSAVDDTGFSRDYASYPYVRGGVDYRTNHSDTFLPTNPAPNPRYGAKEMVLGVEIGGESRAYPLVELRGLAAAGAVQDELATVPLIVVFEAEHSMLIPFDRRHGDRVLELESIAAP